MSLSTDLTHFLQTVGSCTSAIRLFSGMEKVRTSLAEAQLWVKSCLALIKLSKAARWLIYAPHHKLWKFGLQLEFLQMFQVYQRVAGLLLDTEQRVGGGDQDPCF